jgi:hypothetical protein
MFSPFPSSFSHMLKPEGESLEESDPKFKSRAGQSRHKDRHRLAKDRHIEYIL